MLTGGVHKNLTFADGGTGGRGVQNGPKNADVINERPLMFNFELYETVPVPVRSCVFVARDLIYLPFNDS